VRLSLSRTKKRGGFMQFSGKQGIALFVAIVLGASGLGFGSGLLIGRHFPAHSFQRFGDSRYLLDPTTGKVCDRFKDPNESTNQFDHAFDAPQKYANGFQIVKPASNYPPPCGK
jgi:hypothetical protein